MSSRCPPLNIGLTQLLGRRYDLLNLGIEDPAKAGKIVLAQLRAAHVFERCADASQLFEDTSQLSGAAVATGNRSRRSAAFAALFPSALRLRFVSGFCRMAVHDL